MDAITAIAGGGGGSRGPAYPHSSGASKIGHISVNAAPAVATQADVNSVADASSATGKTRAQVKAELLQAEESGFLPIYKNNYPPSSETIARNRMHFPPLEHAWRSEGKVVEAAR
ncbi:DUF4148 domain-containing protein [Paraburkholderia flagellata]|uniref:DUF4148 domain-containing protein n=1 Tax=Paraburkholderia flagellata TaxID=2883241 RepID=UPI001F2C312D|nr:DUF4148 domain-containing protein [Paraburkholderia flagellata]